LVLCIGVGVGVAFNFENEGDSTGEFNQKIRFVHMRVAVEFVRDVEFQAVIASVANDLSVLCEFFKLEYGRLFPGVRIARDKV